MRSIWNGSLRLGEFALPIGVGVVQADGGVSLRSLHRGCNTPIAKGSVCPEHGEVGAEEIVKGWEVSPGRYVVVDEEEMKVLAPEATKMIDLFAVVPAEQLDERLVAKSYYLIPSKLELGKRAYVLVAEALREEEAVGIGRFTAWRSENLCAVRAHPRERLLLLQTLIPAEDLRPADELVEQVADVAPGEREAELASELVRRLLRDFEPAELVSLSRQRLQALVEAKAAGGKIVAATETAVPEETVVAGDLVELLRMSIKRAPKRARRRKAVAGTAA